MTNFQQTILKPVQIEGIGLHSGKKVKMELLPAPPFSGIHFVFIQNNQKIEIKASVEHIKQTTLSTSLGLLDTAQVHTVEHLLSALYGLGIDNLVIQLDDIEVPILDGSALPFVKVILETGIAEQNENRSFIKILRKIQIKENGKSIAILPCSGTKISYFIDFKTPPISRQKYTFLFSKEAFIEEIAPARTFGFLNEVEELQKMGLIQGGSLENAVVVDRQEILNKEGLRFPDEFVRHKILDLIGDFSLLGYPLEGHIIAHCAGHAMHAKLMAKILEERGCWELLDYRFSRSSRRTAHPSPVSLSTPCRV